jgi:hypothetical protein
MAVLPRCCPPISAFFLTFLALFSICQSALILPMEAGMKPKKSESSLSFLSPIFVKFWTRIQMLVFPCPTRSSVNWNNLSHPRNGRCPLPPAYHWRRMINQRQKKIMAIPHPRRYYPFSADWANNFHRINASAAKPSFADDRSIIRRFIRNK